MLWPRESDKKSSNTPYGSSDTTWCRHATRKKAWTSWNGRARAMSNRKNKTKEIAFKWERKGCLIDTVILHPIIHLSVVHTAPQHAASMPRSVETADNDYYRRSWATDSRHRQYTLQQTSAENCLTWNRGHHSLTSMTNKQQPTPSAWKKGQRASFCKPKQAVLPLPTEKKKKTQVRSRRSNKIFKHTILW